MKKLIFGIWNPIWIRLKNSEIRKRIIIIVALFLLALTVFSSPLNKDIKSSYDFIPDTTAVVLVDHSLSSMKVSKDIFDMDIRLKRSCDYLCEIDGIKYYLIDN